MPYKMVTANSFEMADFIRAVTKDRASERKMEHKERPTIAVQFPTNYRFHIPCNLKS